MVSSYVNIHIHFGLNNRRERNQIVVESICLQDYIGNLCCSDLISVAVHPWHSDKYSLDDIDGMLSAACLDQRVIAIGEAGLDKVCGVPLPVQKEIFLKHIEYANRFAKPLIIHCVKCFEEMIALKKRCSIPVVIHGFRGNGHTASMLLKHGFYLSIGDYVLNDSPKIINSVKQIPLDKLFLETDESDTDIRDVYKKVSQIKGIPVSKLKKHIFANFKSIFNSINIMMWNSRTEMLVGREDVTQYLKNNNIPIDETEFEQFLSLTEFDDLLVESNMPHSNIAEYNQYGFPQFVFNTPLRVDLLLTEKCNLRCIHCFQGSSPISSSEHLNIDILVKLCDEIERLNIQTLKITGGEPLLYPNINELLNALSQKRYCKNILSNGLLITDEMIQVVKNGNFRFTISLDGVTQKQHEFLRGKNTFGKTVKNIKRLRQNNINVSIATTLHKNNFQDVGKIITYVKNEFAPELHHISFLSMIGRGIKLNKFCLSENDIHFVTETAKTAAMELNCVNKINMDTIGYTEPQEKTDLSGYTKPQEKTDKTILCIAGTELMAIGPDFGIYPCIHAIGKKEFKMGVFGKEELIDVWRKESWASFRGETTLDDLPECSLCRFRDGCGLIDCRLKPVAQGKDFFSAVSYCKKNLYNPRS